MYFHIEGETAFNGDSLVKQALLDALSTTPTSDLSALFKMEYDAGRGREIYKFYGIHYPLWCLVIVLYYKLEESKRQTWLLSLIKSIKPGMCLREVNFEYLTWAIRRTGTTSGKFFPDDRRDLMLTEEIFQANAEAYKTPEAGFVVWATTAMLAKAEWLRINNKKTEAEMLALGGVVGCRLARLCTIEELTQQLLTIVKESSI